tara:strand:- start:692 stop:1231 length:540 start_codon:yes stop_codon:yes gene_type:complete
VIKRIIIIAGVFLSATAFAADPIVTDSTSNSTVTSNARAETTVKSPPPSAISPSINSNNNDLCTVGVSGAVQTQILGISGGTTVRDMNCERLKLSKTLYDMGMKVAAISAMCQDERVFRAMWQAGTPCPYEGKIGSEAKELWLQNQDKMPIDISVEDNENDKKTSWGIGAGALFLLLLL